jgi:predicted Ser/Thr protein kinase
MSISADPIPIASSHPSPAADPFFTLQRVVAGRYSVVREIGRGGMGIVYLARDVALDRPVAIKLLPIELVFSAPHRERFLREARAAARLAHPHIVPIHAVEEHESVVFFVMAYVDGETLAERVTRIGPLDSAEAERIVQEVGWALAHAHAHGVVHRDVKPANILLEHGSGRALVSDFGIARVDDSADASGAGQIVGTPQYMSPEQASGVPVDARSDIYSLGVVSFFVATGRLPFEGTPTAMLMHHVHTPPPPVRSVRPDLSPRFAAVIDRCLTKDPDGRFRSAEELSVSLRRATDAAADLAPPVRAYVRELEGAGSEVATALTAAASALAMYGYTELRGGGLLDFIEAALYLGVGITISGLAGVRFGQLFSHTRELLRRGYSHTAVRPALHLLERQRIEEGELLPPLSTTSLVLRVVAEGTAIWLAGTNTNVPSVIGMIGAIVIPTITMRRWWLSRPQRASWWTRLMSGRFGKGLFRIASLGIRRVPSQPSVGEPTALAIGRAADALFEELPDDLRRRFAEVPALVARLEADALALRERTSDPARDERFRSAVAALEAVRLDLLRLHARTADPGELTAHIDEARRLGDDIARELEALGEVNEPG